jgi:hypothetical protein
MGEKGVQEVLYSLHPFLSSIFTYVVHMAKHKAPIALWQLVYQRCRLCCVCVVYVGREVNFRSHHSIIVKVLWTTTTKLLRDVISIQLTNHPVRRGSSRHSNEMPPHDKNCSPFIHFIRGRRC